MRVDHFVSKPPTKNLYTTITTNGDSMSKPLETPSVTSSRGFESSHLTWVRTQQKQSSNLIFGRIRDTGINYIVEGWELGKLIDETRWVCIPCRSLPDAQLLLGCVMDKEEFDYTRKYS